MKATIIGLASIIIANIPLLAAGPVSAPGQPGGTEILNDNSCWRYHLMLKPPAVTPESFAAAGKPGQAEKVCPMLANESQDRSAARGLDQGCP